MRLLLVLAVAGFAYAADQTCPPGEVFSTCGKPCESTCDRPNFPCVTMICMSGCVCQEGHHRHLESGKCLKLEECPKKTACTKANEVFSECGPMIESTCAKPHPFAISLRCNHGCFCKDGYVRNAQGDCIKQEECAVPMVPIGCVNENEVFSQCGPMVEATCTNPSPIFLSLRCRKGCFCAEGYIRNIDGKCVKKEECKSAGVQKRAIECQPDEVFSQCVSVGQPSCSNPSPMMLSLRCFPGCACPKGQYRNNEGRCVRSEECGDDKKCLRDLAEFTGSIGAFKPRCNADGSYAAKQCHSSTGYCWCVDAKGIELDDSRKGPGEVVSC